MKAKAFLLINIIVITSFTLLIILDLLEVFLFSGRLSSPIFAILFIAGFSVIVYMNCVRNISLCKVILYNKRDIIINPVHTRNLTVLFAVVIIFLGYGLIRSYEGFRFSFYYRNPFRIASYFLQVITVLTGIYILFQQSTFSKQAAIILEKEINNSIEEIGV